MSCDFQILSATTTAAETLLHFSIQELKIVECSGDVQIKFPLFFVQIKCFVLVSNVCNNFFRGSVSAAETSMKVLPSLFAGMSFLWESHGMGQHTFVFPMRQ